MDSDSKTCMNRLCGKLYSLRKYAYLFRTFRNAPSLIQSYRKNQPCNEAVLWNGARLVHPPGVGRLVVILLELWYDECYTKNGFYRPAAGDAILDLGAHVGLFSLWAVRQNPKCHVLAAEPHPDNYACLVENLRAIGAHQVTPQKTALGAKGAVVKIESANKSFCHHLVKAESTDTDIVPTATLADFINTAGAQQIAFAKIDVESAEYEAFSEADDATLRRIDRMALEYHDNLRPGTLEFLKKRLATTHDFTVETTEDKDSGLGIIFATRRK